MVGARWSIRGANVLNYIRFYACFMCMCVGKKGKKRTGKPYFKCTSRLVLKSLNDAVNFKYLSNRVR